MKKILAIILFTGVVVGLSLAEAGTWSGWVTDAKCAPKVKADCAKKCAESGVPLVFVNSDKSVMQVANPEALKGHEGHHVSVKGNVENGKLTVSSVEMLKDQEPPK